MSDERSVYTCDELYLFLSYSHADVELDNEIDWLC